MVAFVGIYILVIGAWTLHSVYQKIPRTEARGSDFMVPVLLQCNIARTIYLQNQRAP